MNATKRPARNYAVDYVIHAYDLGATCKNPREKDRVASKVLSDVTCKRCLRALRVQCTK